MRKFLHDLCLLQESLRGHCARLQCLHRHVYSVLPGSFPDLSKVAGPKFPGELNLRLGDLVLVPGGVLQRIAAAFLGSWLWARLRQLAAKSLKQLLEFEEGSHFNLAEGCLIALDQLLQGCEGLSGGDVVTAVPVQGLDLVVLHVVASLLEQVFGQTNSEFSPVPNL